MENKPASRHPFLASVSEKRMPQMPDFAAEHSKAPEDGTLSPFSSLHLHATYFPLGFPVELRTNSSAVLEAARQSWGDFRLRLQHYPPLRICLEVSSHRDRYAGLPPAPNCRIEGHLISFISDAWNFLLCDLNAGFSFASVTEETVTSIPYLRYHFLESAAYPPIATTRATPIHAACVSIAGHGILLCGDSGAGKSSLAFAGARAGWTFTSDDSCSLPFDGKDRLVIGNCHQIRLRNSGVQLFPELEGRPITPRTTGKPSIEIRTAELPNLITCETAVVESIIFLNRGHRGTPGLVPSSQETARRFFRQLHYRHVASYSTQLAAIDRILEVPVYELHYTDLDWAIDRLETLAITGR